jgi:hypothetical protein
MIAGSALVRNLRFHPDIRNVVDANRKNRWN